MKKPPLEWIKLGLRPEEIAVLDLEAEGRGRSRNLILREVIERHLRKRGTEKDARTLRN